MVGNCALVAAAGAAEVEAVDAVDAVVVVVVLGVAGAEEFTVLSDPDMHPASRSAQRDEIETQLRPTLRCFFIFV
jgi:hypothetical protein